MKMNERKMIIKFFEFLESKELCVFHKKTLTSPTEKGIQYLIDDFLKERELAPIDDETMEYIATSSGIGAHPKKERKQ